MTIVVIGEASHDATLKLRKVQGAMLRIACEHTEIEGLVGKPAKQDIEEVKRFVTTLESFAQHWQGTHNPDESLRTIKAAFITSSQRFEGLDLT